MQYSYDMYHYQKEDSRNPFCVRICKEVDTKRRPFMFLTAVVYCDLFDNPLHSICIDSGAKFSIDGFAQEIWKEAQKAGLRISDYEYDRLVTFILETIQDTRKPF